MDEDMFKTGIILGSMIIGVLLLDLVVILFPGLAIKLPMSLLIVGFPVICRIFRTGIFALFGIKRP